MKVGQPVIPSLPPRHYCNQPEALFAVTYLGHNWILMRANCYDQCYQDNGPTETGLFRVKPLTAFWMSEICPRVWLDTSRHLYEGGTIIEARCKTRKSRLKSGKARQTFVRVNCCTFGWRLTTWFGTTKRGEPYIYIQYINYSCTAYTVSQEFQHKRRRSTVTWQPSGLSLANYN